MRPLSLMITVKRDLLYAKLVPFKNCKIEKLSLHAFLLRLFLKLLVLMMICKKFNSHTQNTLSHSTSPFTGVAHQASNVSDRERCPVCHCCYEEGAKRLQLASN